MQIKDIHIMRTKSPIDMKEMTLERKEFYKLSFYLKKLKTKN